MYLESADMVRQDILKEFRSLTIEENARRSSALIQRFLKLHPGDWNGKRVALYHSLKTEVQLSELERALTRLGARIAYPKITDEKACLMSFESGGQLVSKDQIELFVVPGLAFGKQGERIGRGKGYYDRYLANETSAARVALAFDFQLFPSLKQNEWDQRVHRIVTESEDIQVKL